MQQRETVRRVLGSHDSHCVDLQIPWTETERQKIFVLDCARRTGVFAAKKKGHWKAECPDKQHGVDGTAPAAFSGLTFLHTVEEESDWNAATWRGQSDENAAWATGSPEVLPGHLIVASAAGQALLGGSSMCQMRAKVDRRQSPRRAGSHQDDTTMIDGR